MIQELKKLILRGNKIVSSLVKDIIMPPIGYLMGGVDFSQLFLVIDGTSYATMAAAEEAGAAIMKYGVFINTVINFLIVAATIFVIIKTFEKMQKKQEAAPAAKPKPCAQTVLLTEIRDLMKKK
jgi:large conductance mechanosensitive channel